MTKQARELSNVPGEYIGWKKAEIQGPPRPSGGLGGGGGVNLTKLGCKYAHRHTIPMPAKAPFYKAIELGYIPDIRTW